MFYVMLQSVLDPSKSNWTGYTDLGLARAAYEAMAAEVPPTTRVTLTSGRPDDVFAAILETTSGYRV